MNQTFASIPRKDCLRLYLTILRNSESKFESAEVLASKNDFGTASSLTVIGIEELSKSIVLFLDGHGLQLRKIKGFNSVFVNHKLRPLIVLFVLILSTLLNDFLKVFGNELVDRASKLSKESIPLMFNLLNANPKYSISVQKRIINYAHKCSKMSTIRETGFYTDYDGDFVDPLRFQKSEFLDLSKFKDELLKVSYSVINYLKGSEGDTLLKEVDSHLIRTEAYKKAARGIEYVGSSKVKNPVQLVLETLKGVLDSREKNYDENKQMFQSLIERIEEYCRRPSLDA